MSWQPDVGMPLASKDPNNRVSGPKYYNMNGVWALFGSLDPYIVSLYLCVSPITPLKGPCYVGPWTLRDGSWASEFWAESVGRGVFFAWELRPASFEGMLPLSTRIWLWVY